ncbi:MAG: DUF4352 domain-containing protein [Microcoleus sp.]
MKNIAIALLLPALLGSIAIVSTPQTAIASKISKVTKFGPWQVSVQSLGSVGRNTKDVVGDNVEAAGHWVVARVRVTNSTNSRQSAKNVFYPSLAELTGARGKVYRVDTEASFQVYESLEERPFNPGESRDIDVFFDTPKSEAFQKLEIPVHNSMANLRIDFK